MALGVVVVAVALTGWLPFQAAATALLVATAAYLWLAHAVVKRHCQPSWRLALLAAVMVRAVCLPHPPAWSDDVYRYLHEGGMVLAGENPYQTPPADVAEALRGPYHARINNPEIAAAYPPAVQYALAAGAWISPHPLGMKLVFGGLDLLAFVALWFGLPRLGVARERALLYGLCPLLGVEFAGQGHSDSLAALFVVLALVLGAGSRGVLSGGCLAVATAGKLIPVVLLPFLARRVGWLRVSAGFGVVVVALYLPFALGSPSMWQGTLEYAGRWRGNDTLYALVHALMEWFLGLGWFDGSNNVWLVEPQRLSKLPLALAGCALLALAWRRRLEPVRVGFWFFAFFLAAAPTLHPWYVVLLVPFLCVYPNPGMLAFTGTVFLAYHVLPAWHADGVWEESLWVKAVEFAPFFGGVVWEVCRGSGSSMTSSPGPDR